MYLYLCPAKKGESCKHISQAGKHAQITQGRILNDLQMHAFGRQTTMYMSFFRRVSYKALLARAIPSKAREKQAYHPFALFLFLLIAFLVTTPFGAVVLTLYRTSKSSTPSLPSPASAAGSSSSSEEEASSCLGALDLCRNRPAVRL